MAVETGLVGAIILLTFVVLWLRQTRNGQYTLFHFWGYAIILVLALHSLLEYPLWYAFFMGIAAFLLGLLDSTTYRLESYKLGRVLVTVTLVAGMLSLMQMFYSYKKLESALAMRPLAAKESRYVLPMHEALIETHGQLFLGSYAEPFISGMSEINADRLTDKLALNERAMRFMPIATVVYRQAWLLALADRHEEALAQLNRAIWAYPGDLPAAKKELMDLAQKHPGQFTALMEFAARN